MNVFQRTRQVQIQIDTLRNWGYSGCEHPACTMYWMGPSQSWADFIMGLLSFDSFGPPKTYKKCNFCGAENYGNGWEGGSIDYLICEL